MVSLNSLILSLLVVFMLISPAISLTCSSQTFSGNTRFTNCTDLPALKSFLHWTYDPTKSTLSVAFIATPAGPSGWIAWGLNPTSTGMVGTQSLVAFKASNGSMVVKTYNLAGYRSIIESKLSYNVVDLKAESSKGDITIFATLTLPANTTSVNQVWQVGSTVKDDRPMAHSFDPENLKSMGVLDLAAGAGDNTTVAPAAGATAPAPAPAPASASNETGKKKSGAGKLKSGGGAALFGLLLLVGVGFLGL